MSLGSHKVFLLCAEANFRAQIPMETLRLIRITNVQRSLEISSLETLCPKRFILDAWLLAFAKCVG